MSYWNEIEDWPEDLQAVHAVHLPIGKFLFWGQGTPFELENLDIYLMEESHNGYQFTNYPLEENKIYCSGHSLTKDGTLVVIGGELSEIGKGAFWGLDITYVFDVNASPFWQQKADMIYPRWYGDALRINTGEIYAFVSTIDPQQNALIPEKIAADMSGEWEEIEDALLSMPVYPFLYQAPNNKVFYAGRDYNSSVEMKIYILDLYASQWSVVQDYSVAGHFGGSSAMVEATVYRCGGRTSTTNDDAVASVAKITLGGIGTPQWSQIADMNYPRRDHNLVILADGSISAIGGREKKDDSHNVLKAEIYSAASNSWEPDDEEMNTPRNYHSIAFLTHKGTVIAGGGQNNAGTIAYRDAEEWTPPYLRPINETPRTRPTISTYPSTMEYGEEHELLVVLPMGRTVSKVNLIGYGSVTHGFDQNQRCVPLSYSNGEITAPANASLYPPGHYMLFVIDDLGTPSIAVDVLIE